MTAEPLSNLQIDHILRLTVPCFKGVYSSDQLPEDTEDYGLPWCLVSNTDCSHKSGQHWVSIYFDSQGFGHYFDSYGKMPTKVAWLNYLKRKSRNGHWSMQRRVIQGLFSPFCGHYAILYLLLRHSNTVDSDYSLMLNCNDTNIMRKLQATLCEYM